MVNTKSDFNSLEVPIIYDEILGGCKILIVKFKALTSPQYFHSDMIDVLPSIKKHLRKLGWDEAWHIPYERGEINNIPFIKVNIHCNSLEEEYLLMAEGFMEALLLPYEGISNIKDNNIAERGMIVIRNDNKRNWLTAIDIDKRPYHLN